MGRTLLMQELMCNFHPSMTVNIENTARATCITSCIFTDRPSCVHHCWLSADELHELLQKEKEQGVPPDSEHAVDAYLKANVADTPDKVITEVSSAQHVLQDSARKPHPTTGA